MEPVTLFLCGDVMTGRGIDQVLSTPGDPALYEPWVKDAREYVRLAEEAHGRIPAPVPPDYPWGDALAELDRGIDRDGPAARIVNLETAVTTSDTPWPDKGIHYRMHPANVPVLAAARIDCCVLANNHVADWGLAGLEETVDVLHRVGMRTAGAGRQLHEAEAPAAVEIEGGGRVLVVALGSVTSGIPQAWEATTEAPGVFLLPEPPEEVVARVAEILERVRRPGDLVVASIHWGGNWGHRIPPVQTSLARRLVDEAGVSVVHGHSSHHVKGIEVYRGRLVLYGCGDFLTDYEGIGGHEEYRGDLSLAYLPALDPETGALLALDMVPFVSRRFRLERATEADARWLADRLTRAGEALGTRAELAPDGRLRLRWTTKG